MSTRVQFILVAKRWWDINDLERGKYQREDSSSSRGKAGFLGVKIYHHQLSPPQLLVAILQSWSAPAGKAGK